MDERVNKKALIPSWDERFCIRGATQLRLTNGLNKNFPDEAPGRKASLTHSGTG